MRRTTLVTPLLSVASPAATPRTTNVVLTTLSNESIVTTDAVA